MRIALDAGHGMKTAGKRCLKSIDPNETREWWLNQRIATKVENKLKAYDVETIRVDDITGNVDVKLGDRCKKANDWKADVYCSFHHNAGINGGAGGGLVVITYDDSKQSQDIRNSLYDSLINAGLMKGNRSNPKVSNKSLYVLNSTKMPAVLVEHDFMDSTTATPIILTEDFAEKAANGWIKWFEDFYGIKKNGESKPQPTPEPTPQPAPQETGYKVKVKVSALNIRENAGLSKIVGVIRDMGVYTIVEEKSISGVKWGKLKSGAGWISLKYTGRV